MDFSMGGLFASLVVSTVGFALFMYGKKQSRGPHLAAGLLLMAFPYFVTSTLGMVGIATLILGATWAATRAGY